MNAFEKIKDIQETGITTYNLQEQVINYVYAFAALNPDKHTVTIPISVNKHTADNIKLQLQVGLSAQGFTDISITETSKTLKLTTKW